MKRILIIRLSAIGDVVFASPILAALRQRYPDAHIAWLAEPMVKDLLTSQPDLDEVILWNKSDWNKRWHAREYRALTNEITRFVRDLRARQFDTVIDMQGLLKSGLWAWLSGAPRRIGLGSREGSQLLMTEVVAKGGDASRISSEYQYLAKQLGLDDDPFAMSLAIDPAVEVAVAEALGRHGLNSYIALCPFTTRPQKHWVEDYWVTLANRLQADTGLPLVLLGGPGDRPAAQRIAARCAVIDMAGKTSLPEAAAWIRCASLTIGVDTGLTHMSIAAGRPTVALFGSTRPYTQSPGSPLTVLFEALACAPCRRRPTCDGRFDCMQQLTPQRVVDAAKAWLA